MLFTLDSNSKTIKICPNQLADHLRFLSTEDSLKIKKGLELFFLKFFDKKFYFAILHMLVNFHYQTVFTYQVIQKNLFGVSCLGI